MYKKILVICTLKEELVQKYDQFLEYLPLTNEESDDSWGNIIMQYKPQIIIFGLQAIDERKLSLWRQALPNDNLKFIRKGTSLHRVDFAAAKNHDIAVLNIPGVNAPFVSEFIINKLLENEQKGLIGIVGVGDIGKIVVNTLLEDHHKVILYNRSHYDFNNPHYSYVDNLLEIFSKATKIVLCLPLTVETNGIITEQHIRAIPHNGAIICISPPRIMSATAIKALHDRQDIKVVFDHVASGLLFIHEALDHTNLRNNFVFDEKAAATFECQYAMGEAAIKRALD